MTSIEPQRFIAFSLADIKTICQQLDVMDNPEFDQMSELIEHLIHLQFFEHLKLLKQSYSGSNPDLDTIALTNEPQPSQEVGHQVFLNKLKLILNAANYEEISPAELTAAMAAQSMFKIKLAIDFDEFEQVLVFTRGKSIKNDTIKGAVKYLDKNITYINLERVLVFVRFKDRQWFKSHKRPVPTNVEPGSVILKLFKNVPQADLEILFPNTKVKMRTLDKLFIGVPAVASGIAVLMTKLGATMLLVGSLMSFWFGFSNKEVILDQKNFVILGAGLATISGYLWKQFSVFKTRQIKFMKTLSDSLYFKNLDNNAGVFHHLIDSAFESECKEVLLVWVFLHQLKRATAQSLDKKIELYFTDHGF